MGSDAQSGRQGRHASRHEDQEKFLGFGAVRVVHDQTTLETRFHGLRRYQLDLRTVLRVELEDGPTAAALPNAQNTQRESLMNNTFK